MKNNRKKLEKKGKYYIKRHPSGGFTYWHRGARDSGRYVPSDETLREKILEDEKNGVYKKSTQVLLSHRGILEVGRYDSNAARAALGFNKIHLTRKEGEQAVIKAINDFWPRDLVMRRINGERLPLQTIEEFKKKHKKEERLAKTFYLKRGIHYGLKKFIERVYPGAYVFLVSRNHPNKIDKAKLGDFVFNRWVSGLSNERGFVIQTCSGEELECMREITYLVRQYNKDHERRISYLGMAAKLSGLSYSEISMRGNCEGNSKRDYLAEELTYLLFSWAKFLDIPELIKDPIVIREKDKKRFFYESLNGIADLRLENGSENQSVEVKIRKVGLTRPDLDDILKKYGKDTQYWADGERIGSKLVVLHIGPSLLGDSKKEIENAGIKTIDYNTFLSQLKRLEKVLEQFRPQIDHLRPRIYDLEFLTRTYESLVLEPQRITNRGNYALLDQLRESVNVLAYLGQEVSFGN